jgi:hypothetical protein
MSSANSWHSDTGEAAAGTTTQPMQHVKSKKPPVMGDDTMYFYGAWAPSFVAIGLLLAWFPGLILYRQ